MEEEDERNLGLAAERPVDNARHCSSSHTTKPTQGISIEHWVFAAYRLLPLTGVRNAHLIVHSIAHRSRYP